MLNIKKLLTKILNELYSLDSRPYIIDQGVSAARCFYRKWSDGTLEQWGNSVISASAGNTATYINFAENYIDTSYVVILTGGGNSNLITFLGEVDYSNGNRDRAVNRCKISAIKSSTDSHAIQFNYYVIGKWK